MLISLVIPTIGRKKEVDALLLSIKEQNYKKIEVIIIDQNPKGYLDEIIKKYSKDFMLKHKSVTIKGASRARNIGIGLSLGDIICFPDDDSKLFSDTLEKVVNKMENIKCDILFGKVVDENGDNSICNFSKNDGWLSLKKHEGMFVEATLFGKKNILKENLFDENLGVGEFYGAEEAYDLVLRLLKKEKKIYYSPEIILYHPNKVINYSDRDTIRRVFNYRKGFGMLCIKHKMYYKLLKRIALVLLYLPFLLLFRRKRVRYYISELLGIVVGIVI